MGACSCFSNSNSDPVELNPDLRTTLDKSVAKKSIQYLQTPMNELPIPEKFSEKLASLSKFEFDQNYDELSGVKEDPKVYRTNYNDFVQSAWKDGFPNGPGKILYENEEYYYEGYLKEGEPYKKGRLLTKNLEVYEGDFKSNRMNLTGVYSDTEGLTIKGTFVNGLIEGEGEEKWANGNSFKGNYTQGAKNGFGVLIWENENKAKEEKYEGEFKDNVFHGKGKYQWGNKKQYVGDWLNGMMDGEGVFTWKDGRVFKGKYKLDKRNGFGIMEWSDGRTWRGNWKDEKQDGVGYLKNENGEEQAGLWDDGQRVKWLTPEEVKEYEHR